MGICFLLVGVGALALFLGLLNGEVSTWHDVSKFGGIVLIAVGLLGSAVIAARRRQADRVARLRAGLPQAEAIGKGSGAH